MTLLQAELIKTGADATFGISPGTVFGVLVGFMFTVIVALSWYVVHRDKKAETREATNSAIIIKLTDVVSELKEEISKQNAVSGVLADLLEQFRKD
jgi:hypothetical protein